MCIKRWILEWPLRISDSLGQLLFYTNGGYIANRNNDTMLNGDDINPGNYANDWKSRGFRINKVHWQFLSQEILLDLLFIPWDYLWNRDYVYELYLPAKRNYTVQKIDVTLDSGKGAVVYKMFRLFPDTLFVGGITACKHANGRDWWLICHRYDSDIWYNLPNYTLWNRWSVCTTCRSLYLSRRKWSKCIFTRWKQNLSEILQLENLGHLRLTGAMDCSQTGCI